MQIWDIPNLPDFLQKQKNTLAICKAIIADVLGVPDDAILWVEDGVGFFLDGNYGKFESKKTIIFRVVSEYLVVHIGLESLEHKCFALSDPGYPKYAREYLNEEAGNYIKKTKWMKN